MPCLLPGQLIKLYCDWLLKPKFFLVVSVTDADSPVLFWISSNKPTFCCSDPSIDTDFLKLTKQEYSFLAHDSWLDCGDVCIRFNWPSVEYQLKFRMGWVCGLISADTKSRVMKQIGNTERLSTLYQLMACEGLDPSEDG